MRNMFLYCGLYNSHVFSRNVDARQRAGEVVGTVASRRIDPRVGRVPLRVEHVEVNG